MLSSTDCSSGHSFFLLFDILQDLRSDTSYMVSLGILLELKQVCITYTCNVWHTQYYMTDSNLGILQSEWAEKYGPIVRVVGPIGVERMMFLTPSALQRILVTEWMNYPRVKFLYCILNLH